ncbi:hypothetical protein [Granulicella mallensis]|uniref:Outer membrane protein beta-barrel domain-containing protein n=1 Tax=Granulicella mallensis (strain ATCC BAA-1857 / DSM 23137 / MP5ACTX8) TaxID=682795 RepID=G8NV53_GRAMM|nr:hypothetical protein [Granulicella mallensis]AEU35342.1 hypothetical protein AciX8_0995 [Granulicella mallensis MP5ACTX8]
MTNQTASSTRRWRTPIAAFVLAGTGLFSAISSQAQVAAPGTKAMSSTSAITAPALAPSTGPVYNNKWEVYGGLSYSNGQAGQALPKHYNMGGGEVMGTYWLTSHLGVVGDYRIQAGTSPTSPQVQVFNLNRVLVYQNIVSGGVQWRGFKNRYAAIDYHALAGATHGTFDTAITGYPPPPGGGQVPTTETAGLYPNTTSPFGAVGGSIDFNYAPRVAIRLQPDLIFEHFGTETREFFSISAGLVYKFGKR